MNTLYTRIAVHIDKPTLHVSHQTEFSCITLSCPSQDTEVKLYFDVDEKKRASKIAKLLSEVGHV